MVSSIARATSSARFPLRVTDPPAADWADRLVTAVRAPGSGDDTLVEQAHRVGAGDDQLLVVTADRVLRDRVHAVAPAAVTAGPGSLPR